MSVIKEGAVSQSSISIEERGRQWAKDYLERSRFQLDKLVLVVPQKDSWVMGLEPIMGDNFALRLDQVGNIYLQRWSDVSLIELTDGTRKINSQIDEWQLLYPHPDRVESNYLDNIPKHKTNAVAWQPVQFGSIESAIRAQGHVLNKVVGGDEHNDLTQALQVIKRVDELSGTVLATQNINLNDLDSFSKVIEQLLADSRLIDVKASRKVIMKEMLNKAFNKDGLNRINPLVMRTRLRSAFLQAVRQLVFVSRVAEKYTVNLAQLSMEKEMNRLALQETVALLEKKLLWHEGFELHRYEPQTQLRVLEAIMMEISHNLLTIPRVKPYLAAARFAALTLIGCRPEHVNQNRLIINDERKWDWLSENLSVTQLVNRNDFVAAEKRVEDMRGYLAKVLAENE